MCERIAGTRKQFALLIEIERRFYLDAGKTWSLFAFKHAREIVLKRLVQASAAWACIGTGEYTVLRVLDKMRLQYVFRQGSELGLILDDSDVGHVALAEAQGCALILILENGFEPPFRQQRPNEWRQLARSCLPNERWNFPVERGPAPLKAVMAQMPNRVPVPGDCKIKRSYIADTHGRSPQ